MKMNRKVLGKRIRSEQESIHRPFNVDLFLVDTGTEVPINRDGIKCYKYDESPEYKQGLNSDKTNHIIHKKHPRLVDTRNKPLPDYLYVADISINKSILPLQSDEQLIWYHSPKFKDDCSYYLDDNINPNTTFNFYVTITPSFENNSTEQNLLNLMKISLRKAQYYINPMNRHKIKDTSTLPDVKVNVCKEFGTIIHLHSILKHMSVRDFKVFIYYLYNVSKVMKSKVDIEYRNSICNETTEDYTDHQILRTIFTKDIFGNSNQ